MVGDAERTPPCGSLRWGPHGVETADEAVSRGPVREVALAPDIIKIDRGLITGIDHMTARLDGVQDQGCDPWPGRLRPPGPTVACAGHPGFAGPPRTHAVRPLSLGCVSC
jgi:hypothetical protein